MDEVSCFLCKSLNLESNSVEVSGALLENIIRIKVLGDLPVDFPHSGAKFCMCHDCLSLTEGIQNKLTKLKDRIVKRKFRVRYANVHFTKSQNSKMENKSDIAAACPTDIDDCDLSDNDDVKTKSDDDRRDSFNSVNSSISLSHSQAGSTRDTNQSGDGREVHIKVPSSVNATFIIVQSPDEGTDYKGVENTRSLRALLESKQVSDVISVPAFSNAQHIDWKRNDSPNVVSTTRQSDESPTDTIDDVKESQRRKRHLLNNAGDSIPKFPHQPEIPHEILNQKCRSLTASPVYQLNHGLHQQVPKIITPEHRNADHVMNLSTIHQSRFDSPSPQLVPDENFQEYLNQRRRSYDVHYPAIKYDRLHDLQHVGIINRDMDGLKLRAGHPMSGGMLHLNPDRNKFPAMPTAPPIEESQKLFHCEICGKVYERKGLWKRHMLAAHQDQAFTCSQCGMKCVDRMSLHVHESREHGHIAGTVPLLPPSTNQTLSYEAAEMKDAGKSRKKMQFCEDCREHFSSKYDLLRHRVTTGHMGGAGGVCSDRADGLESASRLAGRHRPSPYDALLRKPPPLMRTEGRTFRRMESLDDSNVPYVKSEAEKPLFVDRRRSAGSLMLDSQRLRMVAEEARMAEEGARIAQARYGDTLRPECAESLPENDMEVVQEGNDGRKSPPVYSADGQHGMKVSSSSDQFGHDSP